MFSRRRGPAPHQAMSERRWSARARLVCVALGERGSEYPPGNVYRVNRIQIDSQAANTVISRIWRENVIVNVKQSWRFVLVLFYSCQRGPQTYLHMSQPKPQGSPFLVVYWCMISRCTSTYIVASCGIPSVYTHSSIDDVMDSDPYSRSVDAFQFRTRNIYVAFGAQQQQPTDRALCARQRLTESRHSVHIVEFILSSNQLMHMQYRCYPIVTSHQRRSIDVGLINCSDLLCTRSETR